MSKKERKNSTFFYTGMFFRILEIMADIVKRGRVKPEPLEIGMRVSVTIDFLDHAASELKEVVPDSTTRLMGTVMSN